MKTLLFSLAWLLSLPLRLIPFQARRLVWRALLLSESRIGSPAQSLTRLFCLYDDVERVINERAMAYGGTEHPKHRLTDYHRFFIERIPAGSRVLDVGCGIGAVAKSIAAGVANVRVTGIDCDAKLIAKARQSAPPNLDFVAGDALAGLPGGAFDVVVLSNVLEHIDDRRTFLKTLMAQSQARLFLIRVPLFERHWHMPMRKALGLSYFSDPTHFIEHGLDEFTDEMAKAGLSIDEQITLWGEIWAACRPLPTASIP